MAQPQAPAGAGIVLHGVDFSGADSGGAAKIRVVSRDLAAPRQPVVARGQLDRNGLVRAVRDSAADGRAHMWRVDAPAGLPIEILREFELPEEWLPTARWMRELASPRLWRTHMRQLTRREPRRACDYAMATPMAPMNLRVFKQTWTFVCEVLLPLAEAGVGIEPMCPIRGASTVICEGCPASILAAKGWPKRGYKGGGAPPAEARGEIIRQLRNAEMNISPALAELAIKDAEGDLVDALLLATDPFHAAVPAAALVESWVY